MHKLTPQQALAVLLVLVMGQASAATPAVGMVMATNTVRIDASTVAGNSTVLSGNVLDSVGGTSEVRLRSGGTLVMDTNAKVRVYENRTELQAGKIQLSGASLSAEVGEVNVRAATGGEAILERHNQKIVVGALRGNVTVTNREGVLLANLIPGTAVAWEPDPGQGAGPLPRPVPQVPVAGPAPIVHNSFWLSPRFWAWSGLIAGAVAVPVAVVATRSSKPPSSF